MTLKLDKPTRMWAKIQPDGSILAGVFGLDLFPERYEDEADLERVLVTVGRPGEPDALVECCRQFLEAHALGLLPDAADWRRLKTLARERMPQPKRAKGRG